MRRWSWIEHVARDLRHAGRMIVKMPIVAAVIVVSLGVGIGVNTAVFSWIQARLLKPLPGVANSHRLFLLEPHTEVGLYPGASWLEYRDLREQLRSIPDMIAFRSVPLYVGETGRVDRVYGMFVSENYFSALGLKPALGRFVQPAEVARAGAEPVAVISYGLWQTRFSGSPAALGQPLRVNGGDLTVIGVTPREFQGTSFGLDFSIWVPATMAPIVVKGSRELQDRRVRGYSMMGRLRSGTSFEQAQAELDTAMGQLAQTYPETNATMKGQVLALTASPRGPQRMLMTALAILQAVMLLLLLAVCGNTANLVLARASARQREMGVRVALGAGPWRIASLMLTETVTLAVAGAALGAAIAMWATKALIVLPLTGFPIRFQTSVDGLGLAFAMSLGVGCGLIFGAAPVAQLARVDPLKALRSGSKTAGRSGLRNALMGVQVALALAVLIVAGLFLRSFMETRDADPGFRREGVLLASYDFTGRAAGQTFSKVFTDRLLQRLRVIPSVESAAIASSVPLDIHGLPSRMFTVEGRARPDGEPDEALANTVTRGYFAVMNIPFVAGTDFVELNDTAAPPQVVVNEEFVRRYLDRLEPLGRKVQARGRTYTIAGVVRNSLYNAFGEPPTPIIYFSYRDNPTGLGEIHLRTRAGAEAALSPEVRRIVSELDPERPVFNVRSLTDHVETNLVFRRIPARMFVVLGPLLLALAAVGIYSVVAYAASLRTTEIGVRMALGATRRRLTAEFVTGNLGVIFVGALVGWLIAFVLVLDVVGDPIDVTVFAGVPALLLVVAAFACWLPARRASRVDPMVALRQE
jgi:putative ABC transport system permease protein